MKHALVLVVVMLFARSLYADEVHRPRRSSSFWGIFTRARGADYRELEAKEEIQRTRALSIECAHSTAEDFLKAGNKLLELSGDYNEKKEKESLRKGDLLFEAQKAFQQAAYLYLVTLKKAPVEFSYYGPKQLLEYEQELLKKAEGAMDNEYAYSDWRLRVEHKELLKRGVYDSMDSLLKYSSRRFEEDIIPPKRIALWKAIRGHRIELELERAYLEN